MWKPVVLMLALTEAVGAGSVAAPGLVPGLVPGAAAVASVEVGDGSGSRITAENRIATATMAPTPNPTTTVERGPIPGERTSTSGFGRTQRPAASLAAWKNC